MEPDLKFRCWSCSVTSISKPHLIKGTKYDPRIYISSSASAPLRIFLYDEGLVRFASNVYEPDNDGIGDVVMHRSCPLT